MPSSKSHSVVHIVEDDQSIQLGLQLLLESEGLNIRQWSDGLKFLQQAQLNPQDVVVLDLNIPGLSGIALAEELRQRAVSLRVILITGAKSEVYQRATRIIVPFASFRKPIDTNAFRKAVLRAAKPANLDCHCT